MPPSQMAAPHFDAPLPSASFFDIYNDAAPSRSPVNLPGGGCNYVDLTPGANGAKCGCRRFWSRFAAGRAYTENLGSDHSAWCMCNHHACYHDDDRAPDTPAQFLLGPIPGQENEKPRGNREPLSPVIQDASLRPASVFPGPVDSLNRENGFPPITKDPREPREPEDSRLRQLNLLSQHHQDSTLQDTLRWGDFIQSQSGNGALPPIPPQCLIPSQPSSTASSSQARYLRPFSGKGLRTLSSAPQYNPRSPLSNKPQDLQLLNVHVQEPAVGEDHTGLDFDHPSPSGAVAPRVLQSPVAKDKPSTPLFGPPSRQTFQHLSDTVQGHENRLDRLENVSFSAAGGHDECNDKHDSVDLRVTDLEGRIEEVEKLINDNSSHGTARHVRRVAADESANSVVSVETEATVRGESSEVYSHIQSLQSQLAQLQSYIPSYMHAWEVEVVFLPFPLRRIWQEKLDFRTSADEWTQLPNTNSAGPSRAQSPLYGDWVDPMQEHEWLLPKAFRDGGIIDKRLRSRGLIKNISVKGPDARSVQSALQAAFGDTLSYMSAAASPTSRRRSFDSKVSRFLGLQNSWVPLRKIHKDSRLRFLSPAEMVTPATWDVAFLSSVIMRSSEPRLFITQPEAYLQDVNSYELNWTWQRLRELSRVYPESDPAGEVPEADALEDYWTWNDQLDEPASATSSVSIRRARQRISLSPSQPSQPFFTMKSSVRSPSPFVARPRGQTPPVHHAQVSRPLRIRTNSMPPAAPTSFSPSGIRRRVVSYGQQRKQAAGTPQIHALTSPSVIMKRRQTRSPTRALNTPRWTASPSPALAAFSADDLPPQHARGITPLYYATPYSNAPLAETRARGNPDVDGSGTEGDEDEMGNTSTNSRDNDSNGDADMAVELLPLPRQDSQQPRQVQPEDEPWPGIEDQDHVSDGENIDPLFSPTADDDATSVASSQPSEYPSTNRGWDMPDDEDRMDFHIHEDHDHL